ncbi:MAG: hypothetical protein A2Y11_05455 [Planctomycetes bacterium GWC2_39_26]|nr:MAG: hypothetical protein A2Y11_05455 [Planctomycetes bacterium GWC2_39_26]
MRVLHVQIEMVVWEWAAVLTVPTKALVPTPEYRIFLSKHKLKMAKHSIKRDMVLKNLSLISSLLQILTQTLRL